MGKVNKSLKELKGVLLSLDGVPMLKLGFAEFAIKDKDGEPTGKVNYTLYKSRGFMGDVIGSTKDGKSIVFKGLLFAKDVKEAESVGGVGEVV